MYRILVLDSSEIDYMMLSTVLFSGLNSPIELFHSISCEHAQTVLKVNCIDLLIADICQDTILIKQLIRIANKSNGNMDIILTSIKSEEENAKLANEFGVSGWLSKPFKGEKLINMLRPLQEAAIKAQGKTVEAEKDKCLEIIQLCIHNCQYKKSIEAVKEHLDKLFDLQDNNFIRIKVVDFVSGISSFGDERSLDSKKRLQRYKDWFALRYDLQSNRFEVERLIEDMLDVIFSDLESSQLYFDDDLKKILNYIDRNIKKGISLDEAAEYVNMSPSYFSKFFKKYIGINFITYVTDRKIEYAKDMLEKTKMPVLNIAYELSYNETNYFSKAFKKKVGVSPTEYRNFCLNKKQSYNTK